MREGWEMKKLGEVCEIKHGYAFKGSDFENNFSGSKPIVLTPGNFSEEGGLYFTDKNTKRCINGYPKDFQFTIGDLVVVMTDLSSKMKILGMPAIINDQNILHNQRIGRFSFLDNSLNKSYLFYYLQTDGYLKNIKKTATGTMVRHTAPQRILGNKILIPPLLEQQHIVSILDKTFAAIHEAKANTEKNLNNAKELFQSQLNKIFSEKGEGWEEKKLGDVALQFGRGKSKHRPRNDEKLYGGKYPFIQTGDVRNSNRIITTYSQTYKDVGLAQSKLWPKGTICITIAANIAETAILNFDSCFPDSIIGLVVDAKKANVDFAFYALQFLKAKLQLLGKGSAQDNINLGTFENQTFPFPSLKEQQKIVSQLNALSAETKKLEALYQQKLVELEDLKKSILEKAFKGELSEKEVAV